MAQENNQKTSESIIVADSGHSDNNMEGMDMSGKDKNMDMSNQKDVNSSKNSDEMEGMEMEEPIKETPPNVKVLGTYGAVNMAFIIIGVWNKWFRRKGGSIVSTK